VEIDEMGITNIKTTRRIAVEVWFLIGSSKDGWYNRVWA